MLVLALKWLAWAVLRPVPEGRQGAGKGRVWRVRLVLMEVLFACSCRFWFNICVLSAMCCRHRTSLAGHAWVWCAVRALMRMQCRAACNSTSRDRWNFWLAKRTHVSCVARRFVSSTVCPVWML
jgi:hypothetical protein